MHCPGCCKGWIFWIDLNSLLARLYRSSPVTEFIQNDAQIVVRIGVPGIQTYGLPICRNGSRQVVRDM